MKVKKSWRIKAASLDSVPTLQMTSTWQLVDFNLWTSWIRKSFWDEQQLSSRHRHIQCCQLCLVSIHGQGKKFKNLFKHEYLRSRASTCLLLSSTSSVTSQIRDITAIEILVLTSWITHPRIFFSKCEQLASYSNSNCGKKDTVRKNIRVEISWFFCLSDFTWNEFLGLQKCKKCHFNTFRGS